MKWDNNVFCYIVSNIKKELYRSKEMTYDFLDDGLILQLYVCDEKHLLSKWKNRITLKGSYIITQIGFPYIEIFDAVHSYSDALKEYILKDDRKWEDDCRDEVLSWLADWESSFDSYKYKDHSYLCKTISKLETVKNDYLKRNNETDARKHNRDENRLKQDFFNDDPLYNDFIDKVNEIKEKHKRPMEKIVMAFADMLRENRSIIDYDYSDTKNLWKAMQYDPNIKLGCTYGTFQKYATKAKLKDIAQTPRR